MTITSDDGNSSYILHMLLWAVVPQYTASYLQGFYYNFAYGNRPDLRPIKGSLRYRRHYAVIFSGVVLAYLAYTVLDTYYAMPSNHYAELNLSPQSFTARELKMNFKRLSLQAHPDKHAGSDEWFIRLRRAYETLSDPVRRYGYDRFGLELSSCTNCRTVHDYMSTGLPSTVSYYIVTIIFLVLLSPFGNFGYGSFWRWLFLGALFLTEMSLSIWSTSTLATLFNLFLPSLTIREQISMLHHLYISASIAITHIGPVWDPPHSQDGSLKDQMAQTLQLASMLSNKLRVDLINGVTPLLAPGPEAAINGRMERFTERFTHQYETQHYAKREEYCDLVRETGERLNQNEQ